MVKKLCPVHCYHYTGNECPFCMEERVKKMADRWLNRMALPKKIVSYNPKEKSASHEMLQLLKEKFASR